jgi:hypothetical protein
MNYRDIAQKHGDGGYWCQADAVWIEAEDPICAVNLYRQKLAQGEIGISSHLPCIDAAKVKQLQDDWRYRIATKLYDSVPRLDSIEKTRQKISAIEDIELLRFALLITAETLVTVDNWLGHAGTQNAANDALWRLRRLLWGLGLNPVDTLSSSALEWRGSLIEALERSGFRASEDGDIRRILPGQPNWELAKGETLAEIMQRFDNDDSLFDKWFREGEIFAERDHRDSTITICPYEQSVAIRWWTRGYAHQFRLLRAIEAEAKLPHTFTICNNDSPSNLQP